MYLFTHVKMAISINMVMCFTRASFVYNIYKQPQRICMYGGYDTLTEVLLYCMLMLVIRRQARNHGLAREIIG